MSESSTSDPRSPRRSSTTSRPEAECPTTRTTCPCGHRLRRRGLRKIVDGYVTSAELKREGLNNHALRHTAATLAYHCSRDLRAVQDMLGHADPKTTATYARDVDRAKNNPAPAVSVKR